MAKNLFGTDGIRGVAGRFPLDAATVYAIGQALAAKLAARGGTEVLIGMDTRESGYEIAETLAAGLNSGGGFETRFAGVIPTPAVSYLTSAGGFAAGVMISASHNPYADNGVKVFGADGYKLPDEVEAAVEEEIYALLENPAEPQRMALEPEAAFEESYLRHLLQAGGPAAKLAPLSIVADCANGAASRLAKRFFEELGLAVETFADNPDGRNINLGCGSLHLGKLRQKVRETGADLGVAFDGDADRALFAADDGEVMDGDTVLLLAGRYLESLGKLAGRKVVTTVMANMGLEKALAASGIAMTRTKVGDKYVLEEMLASGAALGGEQSGHIIFREFAHTGDGLLTARMMVEVLSAAGKPASELRKELRVFPQKLVNLRVARKPPIHETPVLAQAVAAAETGLGDRGRVVVRYSGTEPLLRIMVEAAEQRDVDFHCETLEAIFERELA